LQQLVFGILFQKKYLENKLQNKLTTKCNILQKAPSSNILIGKKLTNGNYTIKLHFFCHKHYDILSCHGVMIFPEIELSKKSDSFFYACFLSTYFFLEAKKC
jgi:hypothetical protein